MREAEVSRCFAQLREQKPPTTRLLKMRISGVPGIVDTEIKFRSAITAICGLNGVGKSTLLRMLGTMLSPDPEGITPHLSDGRINQGRIEVTLLARNIERTLIKEASAKSEGPEDLVACFIDTSSEAVEMQSFIRNKLRSVMDALNGIDAYSFTPSEIEEVSYISGKNYTGVSVWELDNFEPTRYFIEVHDLSTSYDIRTMSLGEISTVILCFRINRLKKNTIVLLDEPESFISPSAQAYLMNIIVAKCIRHGLIFVVSTHSPNMIKNLGSGEIIALQQGHSGSVNLDESAFKQYLRTIGIGGKRILLLVAEDRLAREFCRYILFKYDIGLLSECEITDVGSESKITLIRENFSRYSQKVLLIGIYDGDQKGKVNQSPFYCMADFLPGDIRMETALKHLTFKDPFKIATRLGISVASLNTANQGIQGADSHDWVHDLYKNLGVSFDVLVPALLDCWLAEESNSRAAEDFTSRIAKLSLL